MSTSSNSSSTQIAVAAIAVTSLIGLLVIAIRMNQQQEEVRAKPAGDKDSTKKHSKRVEEKWLISEVPKDEVKEQKVNVEPRESSFENQNEKSLETAALSQKESSLGTAAFKNGSYSLAVEHFTRAIDLCPEGDIGSKKVMFNNRAAAKEKLKDWQGCIQDTTASLELDKQYLRALLRRARAKEALNDFDGVLEDLALWRAYESTNIGPSPSDDDKTAVNTIMDSVAKSIGKIQAERIWKKKLEETHGLKLPRKQACRQYYYAFSLDARKMRSPPSISSLQYALENLDPSSPNYGDNIMHVALLRKFRSEFEEATSLYQKVISESTSSKESKAQALSELGSMYHLSGDFNSAKENIEASQAINESSENYLKLASLAVESGDFNSGKEFGMKAEKAISNGPNAKHERADVNFHIGAISYFESGDLVIAKDRLEAAIADVPDYGLAHMQLGVVLFRMGQVDEALSSLEQACLLVPELADVHNFHGEVLMSVNKREEAVTKFLEASKVDDQCALPLLNRGVMFMQNEDSPPSEEDLKIAFQFFTDAVAVDPTNEIAYIHLASYYSLLTNFDEAIKNYDEAIRLAKSKPDLIEYCGLRAISQAQQKVFQKFSQ